MQKILLASLVACVALLAGCSSEKQAVRNPGEYNVILISVDTLRADHLGCYGYERNTSPAVDALASDGILFENAYTPYNLTLGSVTTILTGLYPLSHHVVLNGMVLPESLETMAEIMKDSGYATGAVVANWAVDDRYGTDQGFDNFVGEFEFSGKSEVENNWGGGRFLPAFEKRAEFVRDSAVQWLDTVKEDRFFLWLHFMDPHGAYDPPEEYTNLFGKADAQRALSRQSVDDGQYPIHSQVKVEGIDDFDYYVNRYDGEISYADRCIGEIIDYLKAEGLYEDSIIVFVADHGEFMGEADDPINQYFDSVPFFCHGMTGFNSEIRVPLLIKMPGNEYQNTTVNSPVSTVDILATIVDLAGIGTVQGHGRSLAPEMQGARDDNSRAIIGQLLGNRYYIKEGNYKLIFNFEDIAPLLAERESGEDQEFRQAFSKSAELPPIVLYNLSDDPQERINIASDERERTRQLFVELLELLVSEQQKVDSHTPILLKDEATEEALRGLGYIQ